MGLGAEFADCPGCGAKIAFQSADSVVAVCPYCATVTAKNQQDIAGLGTKAALLPHHSKIKIGTQGRLNGQSFRAIGLVQVRYAYGSWNEWRVRFDSGACGWLSDVQGQYFLTAAWTPENSDLLRALFGRAYAPCPALPPFDALEPGALLEFAGENFYCADATMGQACGAGGELPFDFTSQTAQPCADFRNGEHFLTIDYAGSSPDAFYGAAFLEADLALSELRTPEEILAGSPYPKGLTSFACPSCGASNPAAGSACARVFCSRCGSVLDITPEAGAALSEYQSPRPKNLPHLALRPGMKGKLNGKDCCVLGCARKKEEGEEAYWNEYLVYEEHAGTFFWLTEDCSDGGWSRSSETPTFPVPSGGGLIAGGKLYSPCPGGSYAGSTVAIWGAMNWTARIGERALVTDYRNGSTVLSKEILDLGTGPADLHKEASFTFSRPVPKQEILAGFGIQSAQQPASGSETGAGGHAFYWTVAAACIIETFALSPPGDAFDNAELAIFFVGGLLYLACVLENTLFPENKP